MKTYSLSMNGDRYQVLIHPYITNFLIIRHQNAEYMMMKSKDNRWRCLNDGPFCSYIPAGQLYSWVTEQLNHS